ncbi:MAG: hypothetical protein Q9225_004666 [Loekoesia sp. 1 TL-2023]
MDKAVTQTLDSLIPEFNGPLPQELVELAVSLLAQSRNKASNLKAEEEIARSYACTHIACERLKQSLGLPKIQARPPCPPKVYQKLYRYLDSILPAGARRTARVSNKTFEPPAPTQATAVTPRKPSTTTTRTPASARNKRKRALAVFEDVPSWTMPTIRGLCKRLEAPAAPPHVYAGVSSILTLSAPVDHTTEDDHMKRLRRLGVEALIVAVYILVRTRLSGVETDTNRYPAQRDEILDILGELRSAEEPSDVLDPTNVDEWMREIRRGHWLEMDWFENIGQGAGLGLDDAQGRKSHVSDDSDVDGNEDFLVAKRRNDRFTAEKPFLQPGLGTMMQDRVDYLSDEKRADYQRWKKNILARIAQVEKVQQAQRQVA